MISFFEDIQNQRLIKVTPSNVVTLIVLEETLISQSKLLQVLIKLIQLLSINKLSFLWHLFWNEKHVGECVNKKAKYFYVHIFNISNFDHDFGVTLIALMRKL